MLDFDRVRLRWLIEEYRHNFSKNISRELYKWRAVRCFQESWNIEAEEFAPMLKRALFRADRLMESRYRYPCRMLLRFAESSPEDVRSLFRVLYDESRDLASRINIFIVGMDMLLAHVENDRVVTHHQSYHTVSTLLWLRFPDKYFIYRYKTARSLFDALGIRATLRGADAIVATQELYGEVAGMLRGDVIYRSLLQAMLDDECYEDGAMVTAAIDFAEYVARYRVRFQPSGRGGGVYEAWDDAIVRVLGDSGEAMRSADILERILAEGFYKTERRSPERILATYLRENVMGLYERVGRGCYTLSEFGRARYDVLVGAAYPTMDDAVDSAADTTSDYVATLPNSEIDYIRVFSENELDNKSFERFVCDYFRLNYPNFGVEHRGGVAVRFGAESALIIPRIYGDCTSHSAMMSELYERAVRSNVSVGVLLYVNVGVADDIPTFDAIVGGRRLVVAGVGRGISYFEFAESVDRVVEGIFV